MEKGVNDSKENFLELSPGGPSGGAMSALYPQRKDL